LIWQFISSRYRVSGDECDGHLDSVIVATIDAEIAETAQILEIEFSAGSACNVVTVV